MTDTDQQPSMPAGPDLDRLVAARVFGRTDTEQQQWCEAWDALAVPSGATYTRRCARCQRLEGGTPCIRSGPCSPHVPPYSTSIEAAMGVLEALAKPFSFQWTGQRWYCYVRGGQIAKADTAPLAICLAALGAVEEV